MQVIEALLKGKLNSHVALLYFLVCSSWHVTQNGIKPFSFTSHLSALSKMTLLIHFLVYCLCSLAVRKVSIHCWWFWYYRMLFAILGTLEMIRKAEGRSMRKRDWRTQFYHRLCTQDLCSLKGGKISRPWHTGPCVSLWRRYSSYCFAEWNLAFWEVLFSTD